jgi:hypothetical protein
MSEQLDARLNQILPKITSDAFLKGTGLGNEIAFHIFDYPATEELHVRNHIRWLMEQIPKQKPGLRVTHVNLLDFLVSYLRERGLLDRAFEMQRDKGDEALKKALRAPLHEGKIAKAFATHARPAENDLVIVSGVGSAYPLIRSHTLLSNLHAVMGATPLVLFHPGRYDGVSLRIFGKTIPSDDTHSSGPHGHAPYYRAFRLIPEDTLHAH